MLCGLKVTLTKNNLKDNAFKLLKNSVIKEVNINFKNGYTQPFLFNIKKENFISQNNNNLCVLLSEQNIKYKENLFV